MLFMPQNQAEKMAGVTDPGKGTDPKGSWVAAPQWGKRNCVWNSGKSPDTSGILLSNILSQCKRQQAPGPTE